VGSVLWQFNVKELNRLLHIAMEKSRLHIPLIIGFDVIHGYRTIFPVPLAMASSWDRLSKKQLNIRPHRMLALQASSGPCRSTMYLVWRPHGNTPQ